MIVKETMNPLLAYWLAAIERAERSEESYRARVKKIVRRYRDERSDSDRSSRLNILWSNVETLKPALYSNTPKPQIERRYKDNDSLTRASSEVLERALSTNLDLMSFDDVMRACVQDLLLAGRAVARIRYVPEFRQDTDYVYENTLSLQTEKVACDYVYWEDFLHAPARRWGDVTWVAFRNYLGRNELRERFGEAGESVYLDWQPEMSESAGDWAEICGKAVVWEIWDKAKRQVLWIAPSNSRSKAQLLEVQDDPLGLADFFPCPQPLLSTNSSDQLIPVPDYALYQDQAMELDILTSRISALAKIIRLRGVYDASAESIQRLLAEGGESQLVPVDQWSALAQKGGLDGVIAWMPIERMVQVLRELYQAREQVKKDLYEITGIADIIRGATAPSETATAQQLKGRFATLRLSERQKSVARFSRDLIRMQAEIMAEHFSPSTLENMTGLAVFPAMLDLFRSEQRRNWKIDIETDSTIALDETIEKQTRIEFLNSVTGFIKEVAPLVQAGAIPIEVARAMLLFGARGFKVGRELEAVLESVGNGQFLPQKAGGPAHA